MPDTLLVITDDKHTQTNDRVKRWVSIRNDRDPANPMEVVGVNPDLTEYTGWGKPVALVRLADGSLAYLFDRMPQADWPHYTLVLADLDAAPYIPYNLFHPVS